MIISKIFPCFPTHLITICVLLTGISAAHAQGGSMQAQGGSMTVDDPRPVAKAAEQLEMVYGTPITYEDTFYVNANEVVDVTSLVRRDHGVGDNVQRVMIPKGRRITFAYTLPPGVGPSGAATQAGPAANSPAPEAAAAIENAVNSYTRARNVKMFAVIEWGSMLHVVPTRFVNESRSFQILRPLLDSNISVAPRQRTAGDLLEEICRSVSVVSGRTLLLGAPPGNLLHTYVTQLGATNEKARSVLDRLFDEMRPQISMPLSWQLFCDANFRVCALNIYMVRKTT